MKRLNKLIYLGIAISVILFFVSFFLGISEYNTIKFDIWFTQLKAVLPLRYCSYYILFVSFLLIVLRLIKRGKAVNYFHNRKVLCGVIIAFLIGLLSTALVPYLSYEEDAYTNLSSVKDEPSSEYKDFFPYYDTMNDLSKVNATFCKYSEYQVFSNKYIHIQNSTDPIDGDEISPLYDVEYFSSDSKIMMEQYALEKPGFADSETHHLNDISYTVYQTDDYVEIRIIDDDSFYSFSVTDFYAVDDVSDLEKVSIEQYLYLKSYKE